MKRKLSSPAMSALNWAAQQVEEGDEERDLQQQRQARGGGIEPVLLVELHHLLVEALLVALVALLELLHLGREALHVLHPADALVGERQDRDPHDHGQHHDRPAPAQPDRVVPELEDDVGDVDQRLEDVGDDGGHGIRWRLVDGLGRAPRPRKSRCPSTRSTPPRLHGLQRTTRQVASTSPLSMPNDRTASTA
jgi:hypothetical protein